MKQFIAIEDLYGHGFTSSKSNTKSVPEPIKNLVHRVRSKNICIWKTPSGIIALAWLYGYYDGDGTKASTSITCGSREMLEEIKELFDIYYDVLGSYGNYHLSVGAYLMNKMQSTYSNGLARKRRIWDERNDTHFIFERNLESSGIDINDLVKYYTISEIGVVFGCSHTFLSKFLSTNRVFVPKKKNYLSAEKKQYYEKKFLIMKSNLFF